MEVFRHKKAVKKPLGFSHLAILLTLSKLALGEPSYEDKLSFDSEKGVQYQADFTFFGRGNSSAEPKPGRVLPPVKYSPPPSFTDSDTFFKSIGKREEEPESRRRR